MLVLDFYSFIQREVDMKRVLLVVFFVRWRRRPHWRSILKSMFVTFNSVLRIHWPSQIASPDFAANSTQARWTLQISPYMKNYRITE